MTTKHMHSWMNANLVGIKFRYCEGCGALERLYTHKAGWERMPHKPELEESRQRMIDDIKKGGDEARRKW